MVVVVVVDGDGDGDDSSAQLGRHRDNPRNKLDPVRMPPLAEDRQDAKANAPVDRAAIHVEALKAEHPIGSITARVARFVHVAVAVNDNVDVNVNGHFGPGWLWTQALTLFDIVDPRVVDAR